MRHRRLIKSALAGLLTGFSAHAANAQAPSGAMGVQSQVRIGISLSIAPRFTQDPGPTSSSALSVNSERLRFAVEAVDSQASSGQEDRDFTNKSATRAQLLMVIPD
jgi:hypothetical protein